MPSSDERIVMPTNIEARMTAITPRVTAALRDSGVRNAGMPLEMASMPVSAVQPEAKARRIRNHVSASSGATGGGGAGSSVPVVRRKKPTASITVKATRKKYVGTAKIRPD